MGDFPIFLQLDGRAPLIVGGGALAAAKARLLLLRAGLIALSCERPNDELAGLAEDGRVEILPPFPGAHLIERRPLVIAATGDQEEDARISKIARSLGVPVNVPDRPELCSFTLGALVDRGDVTVAIGTSGRAPVLAQRLRSWLEQELHPRLGSLARLAGDFRERVGARIPADPLRRRFWNSVFDGPVAKAVLAGDDVGAHRRIETAIAQPDIAQSTPGRAILVGAGPGDPELLTLKAVRALKSADVILYDSLVGEGVLELARRESELIHVGKRKGQRSLTQTEINRLIIDRVSQGDTVVRLKGGDPFVFGRGGEEVAAVKTGGFAVEVIPGVTAAIASAASLQISLTHRDLSHAVTFISGHSARSGATGFDQIDFTALAHGRHTLAVYMGASTAPMLARRLLDSGWRSDCPVIAVERVSTRRERRMSTSLAELVTHPNQIDIEAPALLLIGEVAGLPAEGGVEQPDIVRSPFPLKEVSHA